MRTVWFLALALVFALVVGVRAEDKETTLKGKITCAKCDLKQADSCATVIVVEPKDKGGKPVVYYFDPAGHKKFHSGICKQGKEGTVTGTVAKEGDKNIVKVSKVEYK